MFGIKHLSIRLKLTLAIVVTCLVALGLAVTALMINDHRSFKESLITDFTQLSEILADNSVSALAFDDAEAATEMLSTLDRDPHIVWATIYDPNGKRFAIHKREGAHIPPEMPVVPEEGYLIENDQLVISSPVELSSNQGGMLWIATDLDELSERTRSFLWVSLVVVLAVSLVAILAAAVFQRVIADPIKELEAGASCLARGSLDFKINYESRDEIGSLAESFRSMKHYLDNLSKSAERIASNDLTTPIESQGEDDVLGNAFGTMKTYLKQMVHGLAESAVQLVDAAREISASAEQTFVRSSDQASQIDQISAAIEEMTNSIRHATQNAAEASQASRGASQTATDGGRIVGENMIGMDSISKIVKETSGSMTKLASSVDKIGKIIGVINDISDQTNLLALNAAIEAARAGEQGRGFAVVAEEVRKLAERTGNATDEITNMIKGIQGDTEEAVQSMAMGIEQVDSGRNRATEAGKSLNEIVAMSGRVQQMIEQIASAAEQQSAAAEQIARNIGDVAAVTEESAKSAEQSATAADELNRQAEALHKIVNSFKV